jgi:hypothetical protein
MAFEGPESNAQIHAARSTIIRLLYYLMFQNCDRPVFVKSGVLNRNPFLPFRRSFRQDEQQIDEPPGQWFT